MVSHLLENHHCVPTLKDQHALIKKHHLLALTEKLQKLLRRKLLRQLIKLEEKLLELKKTVRLLKLKRKKYALMEKSKHALEILSQKHAPMSPRNQLVSHQNAQTAKLQLVQINLQLNVKMDLPPKQSLKRSKLIKPQVKS